MSDTEDADDLLGPLDQPISISLFADVFAQTITRDELSMDDLAHEARRTVEACKDQLPLVKLAVFGDVRTTTGCLRHDANVVEVSGAEVDYDGRVYPTVDAAEVMTKAGIACLVVASPRSTQDAPKWRILAPFSMPLPPGERARMVGRIAGLFPQDVVFDPASWNLSQPYFIGKQAGTDDCSVFSVNGTWIDERSDLDATARPKPSSNGRTGDTATGLPVVGYQFDPGFDPDRIPIDEDELIAAIADGAGSHDASVSLVGLLAARGASSGEIEEALDSAFELRPATGRDDGWHKAKKDIRRTAQWAFNKEARFRETVINRLAESAASHTGPESSEPGWPKPLSDAALYGLAGDFVERIAPHTEADPALLLFDFLTVFGNLVGRGPHYLVEADEHPARLNVLMVGETAKARKGTGTGRVVKFYAAAVPGGIDGRTMHGFSSGEGLIERVRDARIEPDPKTGEPKTVDAGVDDKRLLVIQDEFASTLAVMTRQGNTLAGILRSAFDGRTLEVNTRKSPLRATGAHISQIASTTIGDLRQHLTENEMGNGFANRYIFVCVRRSKYLPDGGLEVDMTDLVGEVDRCLVMANTVGRMAMDDAARAEWHRVYHELSTGRSGMVGAVSARAEAHVVRMAVAYALLDACPEIRLPHLQAALACWRYAEQSVRFVFGKMTGNPIADVIIGALGEADDGLSLTDIHNVLGRNARASEIHQALHILTKLGLARGEMRTVEGAKRSTTIWHAVQP